MAVSKGRKPNRSKTSDAELGKPAGRPKPSSRHDLPKIRVMISSRSMTPVFGGTMTLSQVRERLRETLHAIRWALPERGDPGNAAGRDQALFDVWTHEAQTGDTADRSTTRISLDEINKADVILVLYSGEAGSAADELDIGICHMELEQALSRRPEIVVLVGIEPLSDSRIARDLEFRKYVNRHKLYSPQEITDFDTLQEKVIELLQERVARLAIRGSRQSGQKLDRGQALDWNRLDLDARRIEMRSALARACGVAEPADRNAEHLQAVTINGDRFAMRLDAIPAALTNAAARERVGQPFLGDHERVQQQDQLDAPGVIHLVACHRTITEAQALRILGSPDAMAVASDWGVYALDRVQKVQILFLAKCGNETAIASAARLMKEWLGATGEQARLLANANSRRRILQAIANEADSSGAGSGSAKERKSRPTTDTRPASSRRRTRGDS